MAAHVQPEVAKCMTIVCSLRAALWLDLKYPPSGSSSSAEKVLCYHGNVLRRGLNGAKVRWFRGRLCYVAAIVGEYATEKVPIVVLVLSSAGQLCAATHRSHFFSRLSATLPISAESALLIWWLPITIRSACRLLACSRRQSTRA